MILLHIQLGHVLVEFTMPAVCILKNYIFIIVYFLCLDNRFLKEEKINIKTTHSYSSCLSGSHSLQRLI